MSAESNPLREECELSQEDFLAAKSNPSLSISLDSAIEPSPEPKTSEEEEFDSRRCIPDSRMTHLEIQETHRISSMPN